MKQLKILFLLHETNRTGATLDALKNAKWLKANRNVSITFTTPSRGSLYEDFERYGEIFCIRKNKPRRFWDVFRGKPKKALEKYRHRTIERRIRKGDFDVAYVNTVMGSSCLEWINRLGLAIVWHIHELRLAIDSHGKDRLLSAQYADNIIANSESTTKCLINYGVSPEKITCIYPTIDVNDIIAESECPINLREEFNIPEGSFIIGCAGTGVNQKGIFTFLQLPVIIDALFPANTFYYLWIGNIPDTLILDHDIKKAGLTDRFFYSGEKANPYPYYKEFSVFATCSKEESFGLSAIECAALAKPIICFSGTGGVEEITAMANNPIVGYLDLIEMGKKIIEIHQRKNTRKAYADSAKAMALKFDSDMWMPKLWDCLMSAVKMRQ